MCLAQARQQCPGCAGGSLLITRRLSHPNSDRSEEMLSKPSRRVRVTRFFHLTACGMGSRSGSIFFITTQIIQIAQPRHIYGL